MTSVTGTGPGPRHYSAYGLRFRSAVELPLCPGDGEGEPDVTIRLGPAPATLPGASRVKGPWQSAPGLFLLNVDGVARYLVVAGREIVIDLAGGSEAAVGTFLLGSVLAACLQQRRVFPLHASAIATDEGAVLFAGASGSGKSTLAAALVARGYAGLTDDVTGVVLDAEARPTALSAFPYWRLWADALDELGWRGRTSGRAREEIEKYLVPVEPFRRAPLAVRAVYVLTAHNGSGCEIEPTPRTAALTHLLRYMYRSKYVVEPGPRLDHFRIAAALARRVPLAQVRRPVHPFRLDALADVIERQLQGEQPAGARRPAGS